MKLNVGDYVRTQNHNGFAGGIAKILKIEHDEKLKKDWLTLDKALDHISFLEMSSNVIKSSPNIIDLIRKNEDYVNGKLLDEGEYEFYKTYPVYIKSVVTKEQFEQMEYKVED